MNCSKIRISLRLMTWFLHEGTFCLSQSQQEFLWCIPISACPFTRTNCSRDLWVVYVVVIWAGVWLLVLRTNYTQQVLTIIAPQFQHKLFISILLHPHWLTPGTKKNLFNSIVSWTKMTEKPVINSVISKWLRIMKSAPWWDVIFHGTYEWDWSMLLSTNFILRCCSLLLL